MDDPRRDEVRHRVPRIRGVERDLEEELSFHFAEAVEDLMAAGMSKDAAEAEARRRFGGAEHRRRLVAIDRAAAWRCRWRSRLEAAAGSVKMAARGIARSPGLSFGIVLAFALGIGANATMYGTIDRLLLRPPDHIRDADEVRRLWVDRMDLVTKERQQSSWLTYPDYVDLRGAASFSAIAGYSGSRPWTVGHGHDAWRLQGQMVTASFWQALGVSPAIGRFFDDSEDVREGEAVAVISHGVWQREYGGDRSVVGRMIDFGYGPYTIIGVTPRGFTGAELSPVDMWVPLHLTAYQIQGDYWAESRTWWWLSVVARLAPDVSAERTAAEWTGLYRNGRREMIESASEAPDPVIVPASLIAARGPNPATEATVARWLAGVSLIVLLIACANVANLLLARSIRRRRETGILLALGVSRGRLIGQTLVEGVLLATLGAAAALAVTYWGGGFVQSRLLPDIAWGSPLSRGVLVVLVGTAIAAGSLAALLPAIQSARQAVAGALREAAGGITMSSSKLRAGLSGLQAALSVVLLVGAGLFVRSLHRAEAIDLGFDARHLLFVKPTFARDAMPDTDRPLFFEQVQQRVARLPGVSGVAAAELVPFMGGLSIGDLRAEGVDSIPRPASGGPYIDKVSPDYFRVMGLQLRQGRGFETTDRKGAPPVTVISESLARYIWPDEMAVGRCLYLGAEETECTRIVGVVEDARRSTIQDAQLIYYVPIAQELAQGVRGSWTLMVRSRARPDQMVQPVRNAVLDMDARVRFVDVRPLQELVDPQLRSWKLGATLFSVFGLLALVVAAIGLYSVLSFDVAQRTREIGLRTALGAGRGAVVRIFVARALALTAWGAAAGALVALALAPRLEDLLFETTPRDPTTFAMVVIVIAAVAVLAASLPAWRAARVDPNIALRAE